MKSIIITFLLFATLSTAYADEMTVQKQQFSVESVVNLGFSDGAYNIIFVRKTETGLVVSGLPYLHSEQVSDVRDLIKDFEITLNQTKRDLVFSQMKSIHGLNFGRTPGFSAACKESSKAGKCTFVGKVYNSKDEEIILD